MHRHVKNNIGSDSFQIPVFWQTILVVVGLDDRQSSDYGGSKHGRSVQSRTAEHTPDQLPAHNHTGGSTQTTLVAEIIQKLCPVSEMLSFTHNLDFY